MTTILERTTLETRREELLTRLSSAQSRLRDARFKASMDDAFLPELKEAEELVRQLEQQIEGLQDAGARVEEQEAAEAEAERLAKRRAAAVEVLRLLPERDAAAAKASEMLAAMIEAINDVQRANTALAALVSDNCGAHRSEAVAGAIFVKLALAGDYRLLDRLRVQLDQVTRVDGGENGSVPAYRSAALAVIADVLPDVRDAAVQAESGAAIDPAFLPN